MNVETYPIAEIFTSPQGEGVYAGAAMTFVRLAGCTVGKKFPKEWYEHRKTDSSGGVIIPLPIYTEQCTLYDGRTFACDTDYRRKEKLSLGEIYDKIPRDVKRVCITGGEPLMHRGMDSLFSSLSKLGKVVHLETSGTLDAQIAPSVWVTVSPKHPIQGSMLQRADELKFLVDDHFDPEYKLSDTPIYVWATIKPTFIQPVNGEFTVDEDNLARCLILQKKYPQFRISLQLHKVLSQYLKEEVR